MKKRTPSNKKSLVSKFVTNLGLLLAASVMTFSGLSIQFGYHMGHHGTIEADQAVLGMTYFSWSSIHKVSVVVMSILMIFHIILDWRWYETIVRKNLFARHKQVIALGTVFVGVAFAGYAPWFLNTAGGPEVTRKLLIELHDKLALILIVFLILHVVRRLKWFLIAFDKLTAPTFSRRQIQVISVGRREPAHVERHVMNGGPMRAKRRNSTDHISADSRKCSACWQCIDECKRGVLGKVDLWFHRHVVVKNAQNCTGCKRCTEICPNGVFVPVMHQVSKREKMA